MTGTAEHHREQERPWSCVAACVCMIKASWGQDVSEEALLATWYKPKDNFDHAKTIGKRDFWTRNDPSVHERVRALLQRQWLIVLMRPGPLMHFTMQQSPRPTSKHGHLLPYERTRESFEGADHAVVLTEATAAQGIRYLDPYYPRNGQPFGLMVLFRDGAAHRTCSYTKPSGKTARTGASHAFTKCASSPAALCMAA